MEETKSIYSPEDYILDKLYRGKEGEIRTNSFGTLNPDQLQKIFFETVYK